MCMVSNPVAARMLLDPEARQILRPFYGNGTSIALAARKLGMKPNTLLRRVQRLVDLGLLEIVHQQARGGRAIKHYGVTSQQFFVPFAVTDAATLEELLFQSVEQINRLIARSMARMLSQHAGQLGYLVYPLPSGRMAHDLSISGQEPFDSLNEPEPWWRHGQVFHLSPQRAHEFTQELADLFQRYAQDQGRAYLAFAGIAPLNL